jgi:hypothetical protein
MYMYLFDHGYVFDPWSLGVFPTVLEARTTLYIYVYINVYLNIDICMRYMYKCIHIYIYMCIWEPWSVPNSTGSMNNPIYVYIYIYIYVYMGALECSQQYWKHEQPYIYMYIFIYVY